MLFINSQTTLYFAGNVLHANLLQTLFVTGFGKTDHIVTIDISRNTDLKY